LDETQCDDVLLLLDVQDKPDIVVMWRDKEKIPRFRMTSLVSKQIAGTTDIASLARPYLKLAIERAANEGRRPCDYFLLLGKFDTKEASLFPRNQTGELLALARTPIQREKLVALLNRSCGEQELLVLVTARDDVEGAFVPVPTVVPDPSQPAKFGISPTELKQIEAYLADHGPAMANVAGDEGGRLADYVGIARLPNLPPIVLRRSVAKEAIAHAQLGEVTRELDVPATNDHELLVFYKIAGHGSFSRLQFAPG
jgi:hypothetical protein